MNGVLQTYTYFKSGSTPLNGQRLASGGVSVYTYTTNANTFTRNGSPGNLTFGWDHDDLLASISENRNATGLITSLLRLSRRR